MKHFLIALLFALPGLLAAQSVQREVFSTLGTNTLTPGGVEISQTIGETRTGSLSSSSLRVSEGFQQGDIFVTSADDELTGAASFVVFPNPVGDQLSLQVESGKALNLQLSLCDALGQETSIPTTTLQVNGSATTSFDCSQLAAGSYLLMVKDLKSGALKSLIVQKVR